MLNVELCQIVGWVQVECTLVLWPEAAAACQNPQASLDASRHIHQISQTRRDIFWKLEFGDSIDNFTDGVFQVWCFSNSKRAKFRFCFKLWACDFFKYIVVLWSSRQSPCLRMFAHRPVLASHSRLSVETPFLACPNSQRYKFLRCRRRQTAQIGKKIGKTEQCWHVGMHNTI